MACLLPTLDDDETTALKVEPEVRVPSAISPPDTQPIQIKEAHVGYRIVRRRGDSTRAAKTDEIIQRLADSVSELAESRTPRRANRILFLQIDAWLKDREFRAIDRLMSKLNISSFPSEVVLAPLAVTLGAKSVLSKQQRDEYIGRARKRLEAICGRQYSDELLARYE